MRRIISSIEQKEESKGNQDHVERIRKYRGTIEKELEQICASILELLDNHLIPTASSGESKVRSRTSTEQKRLVRRPRGCVRRPASSGRLPPPRVSPCRASLRSPNAPPICLAADVSPRPAGGLHRSSTSR